jgi:DNA-binding transcriptional LysR family regulator
LPSPTATTRSTASGAGWLGAEQRWTVSHLRTAIATIRRGLSFAWVPRDHVTDELASGELLPLPLREGTSRSATLHLVYGDRDGAGPATRLLAGILAGQGRAATRGSA